MHSKTLSLFILLLLVALLGLAIPTNAQQPENTALDSHFIQVPPSEMATLTALGIHPKSTLDYGAFYWLELSQSDLAHLTSSKVTFTEMPDAGKVQVMNFAFNPLLDGEPAIPTTLKANGSGSGFRLIQMRGPSKDSWLTRLEASGIQVLQYYPHYTYLVWGTAKQTKAAEGLDFVRWQGAFHPAYKINKGLQGRIGQIKNIDIMFYNDGDIKATLSQIEALGGVILQHFPAQADKAFYNAIVQIDATALNDIARLKTVLWLGYSSPEPILDDEMSSQIVAGNHPGGVPVTGYNNFLSELGYDGSGVIWSIVDTGVDYTHPDLNTRIVGGYSYPGAPITPPGDDCSGGGHGTHVAGIVGGDASAGYADTNGFLYGLGVAPTYSIFAQNSLCGSNWPPEGGWEEHSKQAILGNAIGANNSWTTGEGTQHGYQASERTHDLMVRDGNFDTASIAEPFIEVFSAGNSGGSGLTAPKEAKNLIVVASSQNYRTSGNIDLISSFSSVGPAVDGRWVPTIAAPGQDIASARRLGGASSCATAIAGTNGHYAFCSGTSMAAPHASGVVVLTTQWWRTFNGGANPSPAMAKALLVNGAVDMGTPDIPNIDEGWGRINITNIISNGVEMLYYDQVHTFNNTGEMWTITGGVIDPSKPFKVTLAWSDAPGGVGANPALVNNLDLTVENGGNTYLGNVFSNGWSSTGGTADTLNNLENVYIENPSGDFNITVQATNIAGDGIPYTGDTTDQDFALICYNCAIVSISPNLSALTLDEPDESDGSSYFLSVEPTAPVTVSLSTSNNECSISPTTINFDALNWNTGETITITAVDDLIADGTQTCLVEGSAISNDSNYNGLNVNSIVVTVRDNETPDLSISKHVTPLAAAPGDPITYTIRFSNVSAITTTQAFIADTLPPQIINSIVVSSSLPITNTGTGSNYFWEIGTLLPNQTEIITLLGYLTTPIERGDIINTVSISPISPDINSDNNEDSATISVLNLPPTANDDTPIANEDSPTIFDVLANDTDPNNDILFIDSISPPLNGTATISGTALLSGTVILTGSVVLYANTHIVYTPTLDFNGTDSFSYIISDGTFTDTAIISVTVLPVNDAPNFTPGGNITVLEDSSLYSSTWASNMVPGPVTAIDEVSQTLSFNLNPSSPGHFSQQPAIDANGVLSFIPAPNMNGDVAITVILQDDGGTTNNGINSTAPSVFTITITPTDDPPLAVDDIYNADEDTPLSISTPGVLNNDNDPDGGPLMVSLLSPPSNGNLNLNVDGSFIYTPTADFNGEDDFIYIISDGIFTDTATVTITIAPINDAPQFTSGGDVRVLEDSTLYNVPWASNIVPGPVTATDEAGQSLTFNLSHGNATYFNQQPALDASGVLSFSVAPNAYGDTIVTVILQDDGGTTNNGVDSSTPVSFTLHITPVNDAPVAVDDVYTMTEDSTLLISDTNILDNDDDIENDILSSTVESGPSNGTLNLNPDGTFSYIPTADFNGVDSFTYLVSDGDLSATAQVTINVTAVNDAPVAQDDAASTVEGTPITIPVLSNDNDVDNDILTIIALSTTANGSASTDGTTIIYTPTTTFVGTDQISYTVSDGLLDAMATVIITVSEATPNVSIIKTVTGSADLGGIITYTISLTNSGNAQATSVTLNDTLPTGVSFNQWLDQNSAQEAANTITWSDDILAGSGVSFRFTAYITTTQAFAGQTITNTASFTATNAGSGNDSASFTIAQPTKFLVYMPIVLK